MKRLLLFTSMIFLPATLTFASNSRSAVSVNGLDTNTCTVASPCRSFNAAIAQTSAGGEIIALDSAGYGAFTVTSSMTVGGAPGVHAAISVTFGSAVSIVAASTDRVTISNLTMISSGANHGVSMSQGGSARVLNCYMTGFGLSSIRAQQGRLIVDHCVIVDGSASSIFADGASAPVQAVITNTLMENNSGGVAAQDAATVTVSSCTIAGGNTAVDAESFTGTNQAASILVENSTLNFAGVAANAATLNAGNTATVFLAQDDIAYCLIGAQTSGAGSAVMSFGNNRIVGVSNVGTFSPIALQ